MIQYILYSIYYVFFPLGLIIILSKMWGVKEFSEGLMDFLSVREEGNIGRISNQVSKIKKYQVLAVVFILIVSPLLTVSSAMLSDHYMQKATMYVSTPVGSYVTSGNPIEESIEGELDAQEVIEKMKEKPDYWHTEDVIEDADLKELIRIPGKLSAYKMFSFSRDDIVITYTYYSPVPITRVFGFKISPEGEEAYLIKDYTLIYPMNPGNSDPFDL